MNFRTSLAVLDLPRYIRLSKEAVLVIFGQLVSIIGQLLLVRVLTEYLDPSQYGQLALALTIAGLVNQLVMGGVIAGIGRFYSVAAEKNSVPDYLKASVELMTYASAVVIVMGVVLIAGLLYLGYSRWIGLSALVVILSLFNAYNSSINSVFCASRQRALVIYNGVLDAFLKIIFVLVLVSGLGSSSVTVIMAYLLSALFVLISQSVSLLRATSANLLSVSGPTNTWIKQIWEYSWPFITWGIFGWAQQSAPRWALEQFATTADVGCFSVISQLGYTPIQTVINFVMALMTPILFSRVGDASCPIRKQNVSDVTNKIALFGIGMSTLALLLASGLHSTVFHLFVSERYWPVSHYLPWFVFGGGVFVVAQIYASRLMAFMLPHTLIFASIGSSLIGIIASYVGVYFFTLQGAVASVVIHALSYFLLVILATNFALKKAQS